MTQSLFPDMQSDSYDYRLDDGTPLDEAMSVLQKALRRGDEDLAIYYGFNLHAKYPHVFWKRILTVASEDVGNADPQAAILCAAVHQNWKFIKEKSKYSTGNVFAMQAVLYLVRCPKNRETDNVLPYIRQKMADGWKPEIPDWALDCHTKRGKNMGRTKGEFFTEGSVLVNKQGIDNYEGKFDLGRC